MNEIITILVLGLIVLFSYTIGTIAGFGPTILAFPLLLLVKDIYFVRPLVTIFGACTSIVIFMMTYKNINKKIFFTILCIAGMGLPLGIVMYSYLDKTILMIILGIFTLIVSIRGIFETLLKKNETTFPKWFLYLVLFGGGILHGAFNTGGPLIIIYSAQLMKDKKTFRATQMAVWTVFNIAIILQILLSNIFLNNYDAFKQYVEYTAIVPFLVFAIIMGSCLEKKVSQVFFRKLIYLLLFIASCSILISNIL